MCIRDRGDNAPMAVIELVTEAYSPKAPSTKRTTTAAPATAAPVAEEPVEDADATDVEAPEVESTDSVEETPAATADESDDESTK